MRSVPVQVLKQNLADWLNRAEGGERIVITRRNRPIAELRAVGDAGLNVGHAVGQGPTTPLGFQLASGVLARVLAEDRSEDR
jgi:antitoxin (DNA-binding transcriptional repressor) of toxin-antitoxin stability system